MLNIFKKKRNRVSDNLKNLIDGFELPSFPAATMNVLGMLRDPDISMGDIAKTVQVDPGMNVNALRMVNSAAFGLSTKISNIRHAVTLLGKSRLEAIVLSLAIKDSIPSEGNAGYDMSSFWLASARRASLARELARHLHPQTQSEAFTAGLLQDMAVPFLAKFKGNQYGKVLSNWHEEDSAKLEVLEKESLGFDHQRIGSLVAEQWKLPQYLIEAIASHHVDLSTSEAEPAIKIVSLLKYNNKSNGTKQLIHVCETQFGFSNNQISEIIERTFEDAEEFSVMLN
jgi:HD-like signal output (HDOD) protein